MNTRALTINDLERVEKLHEKYYSEFELPKFDRMLNAFIIEDEIGIIMVGAVENVAEAILVTNKERNNIAIGRALVEAQRIALFTCGRFGIRELYAFVDNDTYAKHLIQHGFSEHGLKALSMKV